MLIFNKMRRFTNKYLRGLILLMASALVITSCSDFLNPNQELNLSEEQMYRDWYEYRSAAMGMYAIQQELVEQLFILGEVRADLVNITKNADADLIEIYNFDVSRDNKYASPTNFFRLISNTNNLIRVLERTHPEVTDPNSPITNYDRLYGEVLCMRAWAYFNAVRIYGKVPFIHESLTSIDETEAFLDSKETYIDSIQIIFGTDGYTNDTIYNQPIELDKIYYDEALVIDYFTNELENRIKAVGVNHYINNNDQTWEVTIWNEHARNALLGIMYLTSGDLAKAATYFEKIIYFGNSRYDLRATFSNASWKNILSSINVEEHILTVWFNKANLQQHSLQTLLEPRGPNKYMLKPTRQAVIYWEGIWDDFLVVGDNNRPQDARTVTRGIPGDFYRGYNVSYAYMRNGSVLSTTSARQMMILRALGDDRSSRAIVENADTVIWKYSVGKNQYANDANFMIYRAAGVHLWLAELYTYWAFLRQGNVSTFTSNAVNILNDGSNYAASSNRPQKGVRDRVGFGSAKYAGYVLQSDDAVKIGNIVYQNDPFTNEVIGHNNFTGNFAALQLYLEEKIIEERARELAYEGERFYDLMRVAKRRKDPSFLAKMVSQKFPSSERDRIYNLLLDEKNWYINYFDKE